MNYREALEAVRRDDIAPVYLVFGEEGYLRREFVRGLGLHLDIEEGQSLRYQRFSGDKLEDALAACMTPSFDGRPRLIVIDDPKALSGGSGEADLIEYLENPNERSVLVCLAEKVDRRRKIFTRAKSSRNVGIVQCDRLRGRELGEWVATRLKRAGKRAEPEAIRALCSLEVSLGVLNSELEKLIAHVGGKDEIGVSDVVRVINIPGEASIFALVDAIGTNDAETAVGVMGEMMDRGADPFMILGMVARQIRLIWHVGYELHRGESPKSIASKLGQHPFVIEKCARQSRNFRREDLERSLELILTTDVGVKRGLWPVELGVQRLVTVLASGDLLADMQSVDLRRIYSSP